MKPRSQSVRTGVQSWTALLFVLVMAVCGFVQVVHTHDGPANDARPNSSATHCLSCVASHSVAVKAEVSFTPVLAVQPETLLNQEVQLVSQLILFSSFIRPPPAS
jgi:hypothetical protein